MDGPSTLTVTTVVAAVVAGWLMGHVGYLGVFRILVQLGYLPARPAVWLRPLIALMLLLGTLGLGFFLPQIVAEVLDQDWVGVGRAIERLVEFAVYMGAFGLGLGTRLRAIAADVRLDLDGRTNARYNTREEAQK